MKIGIIQGRLSSPDEGFQECPVDWKREFDLLRGLNLTHIEWIVTKEKFDSRLIANKFIHRISKIHYDMKHCISNQF